MTTLAQARKAYQRATTTNTRDAWDALGRVLVPLLSAQPKLRRASNRWRRGKGVFPAPVMQVEFADGKRWRWAVWQAIGAPLPVERALKMACDVYRDWEGPVVPEVVSCTQVSIDDPKVGLYIKPPYIPGVEPIRRCRT